MRFKKVEVRTAYGAVEQGNGGELVVDGRSGNSSCATRNTSQCMSKALTEIFYSRVSGRRIKSALVLSPVLLLTKGRKHYLTMSFNDAQEVVGAVEFQLHKSNYRGVLQALVEVSGLTMKYDQEGINGTEQDVANRTSESGDVQASVTITSTPDGAEVTIDGAFAGTTPRDKALAPSEYKIHVAKNGYADWERKNLVEAGEGLTVDADLEPK